MRDLVDRVSAATGLEPDTAQKAVGMVLNFVQSHVPPEQSAIIFDRVPGAREAAAGAAAEEGGGILDGLMNAPATGISGLATQLTSIGLGMSQMQTLGREMFAYLRANAGESVVDEIAAAIPGLAQFI